MRRALPSIVATATLAGAAALAAPALAGDGYGYGHDRGYVERDYAFYGYSSDGALTRVRRDGNVFYRAYNSWDGYYRHRLGYWERPSDRYGYGWGYYGRGYGYRHRGYGYGDCGCDGYEGRYGGEGYGGGAYYTPGYGWYDPNGGRGYGRGGYGDDDGDED
ncbi:MAG: hypothetical protein JSR45_14995 [Proteobacteria bacterium]|nr:hypothetical protein [Pseudomonadota bacterium]